MENEWLKALITQLCFIFLFITLNTEIMGCFDSYIVPTLSVVNEGIVSSIIFIALCLLIIVFWYHRFKRYYYVNPLYVLSSITIASIYWYYRFFTLDYEIIASDFLYIGFSDIFFGGVFLFGIISLYIDFIEIKGPTSNETQNEDIVPLLEDIPISSSENDVLGFGKEVDTLYKRIVERKTTSALSIGINARWGDGKSSFINLMEEKFRQSKDSFIVIRFNPRYSTNDTIQSAFFENLYSVLGKYDSRFKNSFNDYLRVIDVMTENKYLSALFQTSKLFNRSDEKDRINKAIKRLKKRIIVIIEDLDRLTADEIVEVFKLIDGNAAFDNLIFVSAYDKKRVNLASEDERTAYSDKFFTWERPLPLRSSQLLLNYFMPNLVSGLNLKNEEKEEIRNSIMANASFFTSYLKNLRDVKRYINLVKPSLSMIYKEVKIRDFLLIELLRYKYPEEHRALYEQNSHKDSETNSERKITIDGLEEQYQSKDILKVLFPTDGSSSYRSINSIGGFSIYFQEQLFEHISVGRLNSMFEIGQDYKTIIKEIIENEKFNELSKYLGSLNALSLQSWDAVIRYIDIYVYINLHYNETFYSIINVSILFEKRVAEKLCEKFKISLENYKSILSKKLTGDDNEYPYEIAKQQLWAYKSGELRAELIFTESELLDILKNSLQDLIKNKPGYTALHNNILRACISSIDSNTTLDAEACDMVLHSIECKPDEYIKDFVYFGGTSSSPDWNNIACDPFWKQIFGNEENIKRFIFNEKLNGLTNIERVRNFWQIYEMNNYNPIEFENQGSVQAKIDTNLEYEYNQLKEILSIESDVDSIIISQENIVNAYKIIKKSLKILESNTLYIKKREEVRKSLMEKRKELKLFIESAPQDILQELYAKIQSL